MQISAIEADEIHGILLSDLWKDTVTIVAAEHDRRTKDYDIPEATEPKPGVSDVIRKHEPKKAGLNLMDEGAASTTKKIVQSSLSSMKKLAKFDI